MILSEPKGTAHVFLKKMHYLLEKVNKKNDHIKGQNKFWLLSGLFGFVGKGLWAF